MNEHQRASTASSALTAWSELLGIEHVISDPSLLSVRETATFATTQRVLGIIRPGSRCDVEECLRIANRYQLPVFPVSSGKNWGYGSSVPVRSGSVILDLSRMNRIVDFNEKLAYVTLEPGVTQGQLYDFLQSQGSRLCVDATGASRDCSIVGNTLERGFGHTPYGDHFSNVCGLEVVLATGHCIQTGFSRFGNSKAGPVNRWGLGPAIDALFSQSNLGVVTLMTVWLMPAPEYFQAFYFGVDGDARLGDAIEILRPLRLDETIRSAVHIGNAVKAIASLQQYPWQETGGAVPLSAAVLSKVKRRWGVSDWNGAGGLFGSRAQVAAARKRVKQALRGRVERLRFLDDTALRMAEHLHFPYQLATGVDLRKLLTFVRPLYELMKGVPTDAMLASAYWRKRAPPPRDVHLERDRCGLIWLSSVVPCTREDVIAVRRIVEQVFERWPFEPATSITMITGRCLSHVLSISYDRDIGGEDERAMHCYEDASAQLFAAGYPPYRLGIQGTGGPSPTRSPYDDFLNTVRDAVDPAHILAPGRYQTPRPT